MKKKLNVAATILGVSILALFTSCSTNDEYSFSESSSISIENITQVKDFVESGTFQGVGTPPIILPGQSISFKFSAGKDQKLMFATMYGASKDWFFAPENPGLNLYNNDGTAITGDVSSQIKLWDNGSKDNITGDPESNPIAMVPNIDASSLMKLNLAYDQNTSEFTLTITNTSGGTTHETPFSPGVWAVSNILGGSLVNSKPFYTAGSLTNPEITAIAQSGNNSLLATKASQNTGIITSLSPLVIVVYKGNNPIFTEGTYDTDNGLKEIAQMGHEAKLKQYLLSKEGVKNVYIAGNGPIVPGAKASVAITTSPEDKITYVSMFGYSNDWFFANSTDIPAISQSKGNITSKTSLYDNGTALDQYPGAGNKQALFGGTPIVENVKIEKVGNTFPVPNTSSLIKITYQ